MTLHLLSFRPDIGRFMRLAVREKLLPAGDDPGYALHAVFAACFGELAPAPFQLFVAGTPGGGPAGRLLAYSGRPFAELADHATLYADPAFLSVLAPDTVEQKVMPAAFSSGARLGFRVRLRPVIRTGASRTARPSPASAISTRDRQTGKPPVSPALPPMPGSCSGNSKPTARQHSNGPMWKV